MNTTEPTQTTDGYTVKTYSNGAERWYKDYKLHRINGPATIHSDGTEMWYKEGELHRINGPAIINPDGTTEWWVNGEHVDPLVSLISAIQEKNEHN